ncbi:MAG: hypothetical protein ACI8R4_004061 [Paracoccaceae bacterium]|jgi:hypothetical protein
MTIDSVVASSNDPQSAQLNGLQRHFQSPLWVLNSCDALQYERQ